MQNIRELRRTPLQNYVLECADRMNAAYDACIEANERLSEAMAKNLPAAELNADYQTAQRMLYEASMLYLKARDALVKYEGTPVCL